MDLLDKVFVGHRSLEKLYIRNKNNYKINFWLCVYIVLKYYTGYKN